MLHSLKFLQLYDAILYRLEVSEGILSYTTAHENFTNYACFTFLSPKFH